MTTSFEANLKLRFVIQKDFKSVASESFWSLSYLTLFWTIVDFDEVNVTYIG